MQINMKKLFDKILIWNAMHSTHNINNNSNIIFENVKETEWPKF